MLGDEGTFSSVLHARDAEMHQIEIHKNPWLVVHFVQTLCPQLGCIAQHGGSDGSHGFRALQEGTSTNGSLLTAHHASRWPIPRRLRLATPSMLL